jgi:hypothetical protein
LQASTGRGYAAIMRTRRRRRRPTGARSSGRASRGRGGQEIASHRSETARRLRVAFHPEERRGGASLDAVGERRAAHRCHGGRIGEGAVASAQLLSFLRCAPPRNRTPLKAQKPLGMGATNAIRCCDSFGLDRMATASDSATTTDLCKVRVYAPSLPPIVVPRVACPPLSLFSRSGHRSPAWRRGAMGSYRCHSHPP